MSLNIDIAKLSTIIGILATLSTGGYFAYQKYSNLATRADIAIMDLDARIERTQILLEVYRSVQTTTMTEAQLREHDEKYERAKARIINLETQRDKLLDYELAN